ncbi:ABC transporter ATP-binding protein [Candidatus Pelagibacter sp. HIMB1695]|uniref:ABC transporter ATP-binding protein n=1 Tax=Candidatus Pelagibacter sp. HIMB1695 TaxID=3413364 RepID=UPI003F860FD9
MGNFKKLLSLITPQEKVRASFLILMMIIMALLDMIGVASILPFMAVLSDSDLIKTNVFLNSLYQTLSFFGVEKKQDFIFALGVMVFLSLILSISFKCLTTYAQIRFVQMREYSIGKRLVEGYLHQPYSWFLSRNSSDIGKTILSEVQQIIIGVIRPFLEIISKCMVAIALISLIVIVDPQLALVVSLSLAVVYFFIFYIFRRYVNQIGEKRLINNQLRFRAVNEAFGASKLIKISGLEKFYIKNFSISSKIYARSQAYSQVIALMPRYFLEIIAFGGILLIVLKFINTSENLNSIIPILSLYIFTGYRLMPALQQIYAAFTQINFMSTSLNKLHAEIKNLKSNSYNDNNKIMPFKKNIILKDINYTYPNSSQKVLKNINIKIPVKSFVGLVGTTGSGKTTMVDIILGLLEPQNGTLEVDSKTINQQNLRSWQRSIGYVPQEIYLSDNNIASNIAFGVEPKDIKHDLIEKSSKIANLHEFVMNELPNKYQTIVGERGVRLSGGQRQRIGIARALYHDPEILIFDEATSSLDTQTEQAVMDAINIMEKSKTIVLIAHRLNTVKNCDIIYNLEKGEIKKQGTFQELYQNQ